MVSRSPKDAASEAARWFVRWSDGSEVVGSKEQSRWISWLQRSPTHVSEYFAVDDLCARLGESEALKDFDVDAWMAGRRANVVRLNSAVRAGGAADTDGATAAATGGTHRRSHWLHWAAAAVIVAVSAGTVFLWSLSESGVEYRTDVGEQKTVHLADGSVLQLNTRSEVHVSFDDGAREVVLDGEAFFTVAPDAHRPFLVRTHRVTVRAIGTRFNVYEEASSTHVAVLEGRVQVSSVAPGQSFELGAGEEARVANGVTRKEPKPNVDAATAWQNRTLVFERAKLVDVAREFNRYNVLQFRVDPAISDANRLSGTFDARHPESLLLWLQSRPDIEVSREGAVYNVREVGAR